MQICFTLNRLLEKDDGLMHSVSGDPTAVTSLPSVEAYTKTVYILNAGPLSNPLLPGADPGQQITFIASGGSITFNPSVFQGISSVSIAANGSITVIYIGAKFHIVASQRATIVYS